MLYRAFVVTGLALVLATGCGTSPEPEAPSDAPPSEAPTAPPTARSGSLRRPDLAPDELAAVQARQGERAARALAEIDKRFSSRPADLSFRIHRVVTSELGDTHVSIQQVFR